MQTIKQVASETKKMGDRSALRGARAKIYYHLIPIDESKWPLVGEGWRELSVVPDFGSSFRIFANGRTLELLSYMSGDWRLMQCVNRASYRKEISELRKIKVIRRETNSN